MGRSAARYGRKQVSLSCTFSRLAHAVNREHSEGRLNLCELLMMEYPSLLAVVQAVALLNQNLFWTTCFPVCFPHRCWRCVALSRWVCCLPCTFLSCLTLTVLFGDKNHLSPASDSAPGKWGKSPLPLSLALHFRMPCSVWCHIGPSQERDNMPQPCFCRLAVKLKLQQSNSFSRKLFFFAFLSGGS